MSASRDGVNPSLLARVELSEAATRRAPEPLDLVQSLVNSLNRIRGYDLLVAVPAARWWLGQVAEDLDPTDVSDAGLCELVRLREGLRSLLRCAGNGTAIDQSSLAALRSAGTRYPLEATFAADRSVGVGPARSLADSPVATIGARVLAALATAGAPDALGRLKVCANLDCEWAFYDASRSRSGRWCSMNLCGARHKMTRYRSRSAGSRTRAGTAK